ncbi:hypothetical protein LCGC14_2312260 [marine sediment metagenome]|uniref:Uncharacterized protein n=1 Tax=marine sediment metagenome TaxID=412755 RepID=A0A0F9CKF1_9ZZZZ
MNKEEEIKKFLTDLNKSEEGKKMLRDLNPSTLIVPEVKDKKKNWRWWGKHFNKDKIKKPNRVGVVYLRNNGNVDLLEVETRDGQFAINGKPYHEDRHCVYTLTKERIPLMVVREWDMIPLGTKKWDDEPMSEKFAELEQHVLKGIRNAELVKMGGGVESKLTTKQMILWGLVILVGAIILVNYI